MQRVLGLLVLLLLSGGVAYPVLAVEPAKPFIRFWNFGGGNGGDAVSQWENFLSLDIVPGTSGLELPGIGQKTVRSTPDANHKITLTATTRLQIRAVNGGAVLLAPTPLPALTSGKFPDPSNPLFQCGGLHMTFYGQGNDGRGQCACPPGADPTKVGCFDPKSDYFPRTFNMGMGIGNFGGTRVLVFGDAITGNYSNDIDGDNVVIGTYMVAVYNPNGTRRWTRSFTAMANGFHLEPILSGAAAFHISGRDEVRIAYVKDSSSGSLQFQYQFFDLLSGALTSTVNFTTPSP